MDRTNGTLNVRGNVTAHRIDMTGAHICRSLIMTARDQITPKNFDHSVSPPI